MPWLSLPTVEEASSDSLPSALSPADMPSSSLPTVESDTVGSRSTALHLGPDTQLEMMTLFPSAPAYQAGVYWVASQLQSHRAYRCWKSFVSTAPATLPTSSYVHQLPASSPASAVTLLRYPDALATELIWSPIAVTAQLPDPNSLSGFIDPNQTQSCSGRHDTECRALPPSVVALVVCSTGSNHSSSLEDTISLPWSNNCITTFPNVCSMDSAHEPPTDGALQHPVRLPTSAMTFPSYRYGGRSAVIFFLPQAVAALYPSGEFCFCVSLLSASLTYVV